MKDVKRLYRKHNLDSFEINSDSKTIRKTLERDMNILNEIYISKKQVLEEELNSSYHLTSIINHSGKAECGHFSSFIKINGQWFSFDDSRVFKVTENDVFLNSQGKDNYEKNCYCLFYSKSKKKIQLIKDKKSIDLENYIKYLPNTIDNYVNIQTNLRNSQIALKIKDWVFGDYEKKYKIFKEKNRRNLNYADPFPQEIMEFERYIYHYPKNCK